jgi:hypothetical protein
VITYLTNKGLIQINNKFVCNHLATAKKLGLIKTDLRNAMKINKK